MVKRHRHGFLDTLDRRWHAVCLAVYLSICVFDFAFMPIVTELGNLHASPTKMVDLALRLNGSAAQVAGLQILRQQQTWEPLTLGQSGLFHVAFGAILGVGAWRRCQLRPLFAEAELPSSSPESSRPGVAT